MNSDISDPVLIPVSYISIGFLKRRYFFPYSDSCFYASSSKYNLLLAQSSLGLSVSADRDYDVPLERQNKEVLSFLETAGFTDIRFFRFNSVPETDTAALSVAEKKLDGFTLISVVICGNGYGDEWVGNIRSGEGNEHLGFKKAADLCFKEIELYVKEKQKESSNIKIWASGYSRAAAILSVMSPLFLKRGLCSELYAYLFATPNNTRNAEGCAGVFNIINPADPFTKLSPLGFNFGRCGKDIILKTEKDFHKDLRGTEKRINLEKTNMGFLSSVETVSLALGARVNKSSDYVDSLFNTLIDFFNKLFHSLKEYSLVMQEPLVQMYYCQKTGNISLGFAFKVYCLIKQNIKKYLPKERQATFKKMVRFVLKQIVMFKKRRKSLVKCGEWSESDRLDTNFLREHASDMYVIRLFSQPFGDMNSNDEIITVMEQKH